MAEEKPQTARDRLMQQKADIGKVLQDLDSAERELAWLHRLCALMFKHTAPGLSVEHSPGLAVRDMVSHPNDHLQRQLKYGTASGIEALWEAYE